MFHQKRGGGKASDSPASDGTSDDELFQVYPRIPSVDDIVEGAAVGCYIEIGFGVHFSRSKCVIRGVKIACSFWGASAVVGAISNLVFWGDSASPAIGIYSDFWTSPLHA